MDNRLTSIALCVLVSLGTTGCEKKKRSAATKIPNSEAVEFQKSISTLSKDGWWTPKNQTEPRVKFAGDVWYYDFNGDGEPDFKLGDGHSWIRVSNSWLPIREQKFSTLRGCNVGEDYQGKFYRFQDGAWQVVPKQ